ncbi:MAG: polysaccharide pyruvyl transferase family protein, partial [Flavobacterium sp.]
VFIFAYAEYNLGDDLFIKILLDRYPKHNFYLVAEQDYNNIFENYDNITIVPRLKNSLFKRGWNFIQRKLFANEGLKIIQNVIAKEHAHYFKGMDAIVVIGGSLFQQYRIKPYYYEMEIFKNISSYSNQKAIFYLGCNFGPFVDQNYVEQFRAIFSKALDVSFRDQKSFDLFKDLKNVRFNSDIVYTLKNQEEENQNFSDNKSVGFSIVSPLKEVREFDRITYVEKYTELINSYISDQYIVKLFSFCKKEGDEAIINEIYDRLGHANVQKIFYEGDIELFLNEFKSVEEIYSGRFHAMILGMMNSQKIFPVIYSKKMTNILDDIDYKGETIDLFNFQNLNIETTRKQIFENHYNITGEKQKANLHFAKLDEFFGKKVIES